MRTIPSCLYPTLLALTACAEPTQPVRATGVGPAFELAHPDQRLDAASVKAHTYGTFVMDFDGSATVIRSGPANFPGNPPGGPGSCVDGLWINSRGKPTAGDLAHPHPHCVTAGTAVSVVLQPISSMVHDPRLACRIGQLCDFLYFTDPRLDDLNVVNHPYTIKGGDGSTTGEGVIYAYAIDAATLNGANVQVGTISLDLSQYNEPGVNLFGDCTLGDDAFDCLPRIVTADYTPLRVGGVGQAMQVSGFLWWAMAAAPYNY